MSVECCGEVRHGKFCNQCGKKLIGSDLEGLREYLLIQQKHAVKRCQRSVSPSADNALKRWTRWVEALQKVMDE